jgi:hypothetical protein
MIDLNNLATVTIGCPISNRSYLIDRYLKGIYNLDYPKNKIKLYFLVNNSQDSTESDLNRFRNKYKKEYLDIKIDKYNLSKKTDKRQHKYREEFYNRLATLRNYILDKIDTDYFFSVDSDVIVNQDVLIELLKSEKDIIAAVINNDQVSRPYAEYPNIRTNLLHYVDKEVVVNNETKMVKTLTHYLDYPLNDVVEVDVTGAVYLLTNDVCSKVKYEFHELGEDVSFCDNAKIQGYKIYADTGLLQKHIMCEYMDYCIDNKCQNPCIFNGSKDIVYQYKYRDNIKHPDLYKCGHLTTGDKPLLTNLI